MKGVAWKGMNPFFSARVRLELQQGDWRDAALVQGDEKQTAWVVGRRAEQMAYEEEPGRNKGSKQLMKV